METSELIKFGVLALIVVVIAVVARRGQAHSTPVPPQKSDPAGGSDHPDHAGDEDSAGSDTGARPAGGTSARRAERRRRR